jgi:hypothetical protein
MKRQVTPEQEARRARLVDAAPELYEALKNARELLSWWQGERGDSIHAGVMELADAALAKVEGV